MQARSRSRRRGARERCLGMRQLFIPVVMCALSATPALAQYNSADATAPVGAQAPGSATSPESHSHVKAAAGWIGSVAGRGESKDGFYAHVGGLPPGSGISVGPGYRRALFGDRAVVVGFAAVSSTRGTIVQGAIEVPRLAGQLSVGAQITRQDFTRISFYGAGASSLESNASQFALKNTDYAAFATVKPGGRLSITGRLGLSSSVTIDSPQA